MREINYFGTTTKLVKYLSIKIEDLTYSTLQKLLRNGDIKLNGKKLYKDTHIVNGDNIKVYCKEVHSTFEPQIVYEDDNIIIFNKPVKIASQGEYSFESKVKLHICSDYVLCHRLDTNTQGLLMFAKSEEIFEIIKDAFRDKKIEKHYFAIVYGQISEEQTYIDYLLKDEIAAKVKIFKEQVAFSQQIITKVTPLEYKDGLSFVDVELVTGKTHQIRAHLAFKGFPIIGDSKYGVEAINRIYKAKTQKLVAYKLIFKTDDDILGYLFNKEICIDYTFLTLF